MKITAVFRTLAAAIVTFTLLIQPITGVAGPAAQTTPETRAQALLESLTPEERVGQLFLVDFEGAEIATDSPIYELVTQHHIGGVVLKAENDNFVGPDDTLSAAWGLIQSLQNAEETASQISLDDPGSEEVFFPSFIPLFISIAQNGDGFPDDEILHGLTPIPSQMAIGATWDIGLAEQAGEVVGRELSSLGINLLLGPSLDILDPPHPEFAGDLGILSYGGSPYWVGAMGGSFISGIHAGSNHQMAVFTKHFPGQQSSVRPPEEEIPTVLKTLEQLKQVELSPFFSVTGLASDPVSMADGLLVSHSRYAALQGDISTSTRPVSADPQAIEQLMALPEFNDWYANGGLVISDELGARAIRRFYDPTEAVFNPRVVALNTFLAGNDLLVLGDFLANDAPDEFTTITRTLSFFAQKYRDDLAFAQRVDKAALRILTLKFKLYDEFTVEQVLTDEAELADIGNSDEITFNIARQAVTLFSPTRENLDDVLPEPPAQREIVVIITDSFPARQCAACPQTEALPSEDLAAVVNRLYGPSAGGPILSRDVFSYSFFALNNALDTEEDEENQILPTLELADWIIFVMLDIDQARPASNVLQRILSDRPALIQDKNTIVFSLNAPYYLDATDISKLTAYYGLYSKQPQFIEVAARLLFKELTTPGASPVSIDGIGYFIAEATSPDPDQSYNLLVYPADVGPPPETGEGTPAAPIDYQVGDTVVIETEAILDYNGHQVPDNTSVTITLNTTTAEGSAAPRQIEAMTMAGVARASFILETAGVLDIQVASGDPAAVSEIVQVDVADNGETGPVIVVTGTPPPTDPAEVTPVVTPVVPPPPPEFVALGDWLLALLVTIFISLFAYQVGATTGQVRWGVRWGLSALIGGMLVNAYLSFDLPGASAIILEYQLWGIVISASIGALLGWLMGLIWRNMRR